MAAHLGVRPVIVGLTVVAMGTSAPELAVSVMAALRGSADLALGNVVGSNIFNILFILGVSAIITPLAVAHKLVRVEVPLMIGTSALVVVLVRDGAIGVGEGVVLCGLLVAYIAFSVFGARRSKLAQNELGGVSGGTGRHLGQASLWRQVVFIVVGLVLLILGSRWLLAGTVDLARALGLSRHVVGLTIVAAGTSLPEVATSIVAAVRGERDIAIGNVVGSNIFNVLGGLGLAGALAPGGIQVSEKAISYDIPVMIAASLVCLPIFFTRYCISRWEGLLLLGYYCAYVSFLILDATGHRALPDFTFLMSAIVLPLAVLVIAISVARHIVGNYLQKASSARGIGKKGTDS